jgi:bacillithiol biosynthesis cysteine-adding enzyme BshC
MSARLLRVLDYGEFQQPTSPLFRDYLSGAAGVVPFYGSPGFGMEALLDASRRTKTLERPRRQVADALAAQQEARGSPAAAKRAALLADPDTTAIVTGQQPGLFGGPLYVLYKALGALETAKRLSAAGQRAVGVFWVASDDHDFAEVRSTSVIDESGQIRTLRYAPAREPVGLPAWKILLDASISSLVAELGQSLPQSLFRDEVVALLGESYRPGATLSGAFARFLSALLPELVVLDPADPVLKALTVPVLSREIAEGSPTSRLAMEAGRALLAAGYHQQVPVRPGFLNLFVLMEGERRALGVANGYVEVRGLGRKLTPEEALRNLQREPTDWSPGVLLRPLAQDALLPTTAYVGGPAEIAYHAQIGPSYPHFAIPRPVIMPRPSLTVVEPAQARALDAEGLKLTDLEADPGGLLARWAREAYPDVEAAFARTREAIEREMGAVEAALGALDPTLRAAADSARGRALHPVEALHEKAIRALKKRDLTRAERIRRTRDALFPGGSFQERGLGLVGLLARHGRGLVPEIADTMDPFAHGHQVIAL